MMPLPERLQRFAEPTIILPPHGTVTLLDVMGDDRAVAAAARTSYAADDADYSDGDVRRLIRYLLSHRHTTPFETGCEIKLHVKLPIFVERQWARHRTAHWNEMSGRYAEFPAEYYVPDPKVRPMAQASGNKQGSEEGGNWGFFPYAMETHSDLSYERYLDAVQHGAAKEIARCFLPVNWYTIKVWKVDLHNLIHFLGLRLDSHAQWEIRQYAKAIRAMLQEWCPMVWEAVEDYRLKGAMLSRMEMEVTRHLLTVGLIVKHGPNHSGWTDAVIRACRQCSAWEQMTKRERAKYLHRMGILR